MKTNLRNSARRSAATRNGRVAGCHFTLLEVFVACSIMLVLMTLMVQAIGKVESVCSASQRRCEVYESARIVFGLLSQDMRGALAREDDLPGKHIRFHQESPTRLWFVTTGDPGQSGNSNIMEVGYRLDDDKLQRAFVQSPHPDWNIYGARDAATGQNGYQTVVDGILDFEITCYDSTGNSYIPNTEADETDLPTSIKISMTLLDRHSMQQWWQASAEQKTSLKKQRSRSFAKTIFLNKWGS
jgi:type II secretion system protein J